MTLINPAMTVSNNLRPACADDDAARIKLVLVDDDDDYREAASAELDYLGFDTVALASGEALLDGLDELGRTEIIVIDWKLPGGLGIDLLKPLRDRGCDVPVIFLTAVPATAYESAALDGGAIDFVDKARGIAILAKRIRTRVELVRRLPPAPTRAALRCGPVVVRPDVSGATWHGASAGLTVTEFNIVHLLVSQAGEYVPYRAIYDCVHRPGFHAGDGVDGYRTNVRSSIKRIRGKFRALDPAFSEIENFAAFGYRWRSGPATPV
jgi:two-component system, OmpR family, response regulator ChvI